MKATPENWRHLLLYRLGGSPPVPLELVVRSAMELSTSKGRPTSEDEYVNEINAMVAEGKWALEDPRGGDLPPISGDTVSIYRQQRDLAYRERDMERRRADGLQAAWDRVLGRGRKGWRWPWGLLP